MLSSRRMLLAAARKGGQGKGANNKASSVTTSTAAAATSTSGRSRSKSNNSRGGGDKKKHNNNNKNSPSSAKRSGSGSSPGKPSLSQKSSVDMSSLMQKGVDEAARDRPDKQSPKMEGPTVTTTPTPTPTPISEKQPEVATTPTPTTTTAKPAVSKYSFNFGESPAEKAEREDKAEQAVSSFGGRSLDGSRIPTEGEAAREFAEKMADASLESVLPEDSTPISQQVSGGKGGAAAMKPIPSTLGLFCRQWKYSVLNPTEASRVAVLKELKELEENFKLLPGGDSKSPGGALKSRKEGQLMMAKLRAGISFQMSEEFYGPSIGWLTVHFKRLSDEDFAMALHDIHCLAGHIQDHDLAHSHATLQQLMMKKMKENADVINASLSSVSRLATAFHYVNRTRKPIPAPIRIQLIAEFADGRMLVEASKETDPAKMAGIGLMSLAVQGIICSDGDSKHVTQIVDGVMAKNPNLSIEVHPDHLQTILRALRAKKAVPARKAILTKGLMEYVISHDYDSLYQILTWSYSSPEERKMISDAIGDCSMLEELRVAVAAAGFVGTGNNAAVRRGVELLLGPTRGSEEAGDSGDGSGEEAVVGGEEDTSAAAPQDGEEEVYLDDSEYEGYEETNDRHGTQAEDQSDLEQIQSGENGEGLSFLCMKHLCHQDIPETKQILCLLAQPAITRELNQASIGSLHIVDRFLSLIENGVVLTEDDLAEMAPPNQPVHERIQVMYSTDNVLVRWSLGIISGTFDASIEPLIHKVTVAQLSHVLLQVSRIYKQLGQIRTIEMSNPKSRLVDDLDSSLDLLAEMGERFAIKYMESATRGSPLVARRAVILRLPMELEDAQKLATQFVTTAGTWGAAVMLREVLPIAIQEPANPALVARVIALIQRAELPKEIFSLFHSADDGPIIVKNVHTLVQYHTRFSPDSQIGPSVVNRVARWYASFLTALEAGLIEHPEWATSSPPPMQDVEDNATGFADLFEIPPQVSPRPWHVEEVLSILFQARASIPAELNTFVKKNVWDIFYGEPDACSKLLQEFPEGLPRRFTSHYVSALRSQILNHMDLSPRNLGLMLDTSQASGYPLLLLSVEQAGGDTIPILKRVVECPSPTCALVLRVWGAAPAHSTRTFLNDPTYPDILALLETIAERVSVEDACQLLRSSSHITQLPPSVVELLWDATDEALLVTSDAELPSATPAVPTPASGDVAVPLSKPKMQGLPQPECLLSIAIKVPHLADDICMALAGRQVNFVHLLCNMQAKVPIQFVNCAMEQCCKQIVRAKPPPVVAAAPEVAEAVESENVVDEVEVSPEADVVAAEVPVTETAVDEEDAPDTTTNEEEEDDLEVVTPPTPPPVEKPLTTATPPAATLSTSAKKPLDNALSASIAAVFANSVRLLKYLDQHVFTFEGIEDLAIDTLLLFTRLLNTISELQRGASPEVDAMLLTSGRIYGRLLRRRAEVEELLGLEPTVPQRARRQQRPPVRSAGQTDEDLTVTLAALNGVILSTSAIIDAFVKFDASTPERLQRTFGTVPQSMKRLMMDIKLEDLVVEAIMSLPQPIYKLPADTKKPAAEVDEDDDEDDEVVIPRALNATTSGRLFQYIETLERNNVYQDKAQAAVVKVVTRPLVDVYRRAVGKGATEVPEGERKKVHTVQLTHIEYTLSVLRSSLRGGASDETIAKVTRGLILAGNTFKAGANSSGIAATEVGGGTTVVDHLGRLLQVFLDAPVKSKAHKLVVEALMSDEVVPDLTGPWFAKITVAMSRLGSLGDFRDRIGSLLGRLFAAADPHSQTLIFRALSADEQIVKNNLDLLFDVIERSVSVLSPEDLENVASALTQTSSFIAFADVEDLVEQLCVRVMAVIDIAKKSSLVRILHLLTHFKLQDVGVLEGIYTSLEDKMPKLDVNQLLTILSSMVELDMIPRERLILQVVKRLETNVDNMSPQHVVHTLSHLVDLNVAFLPVTNSLFMKASESKDAIRQSKTLQALMEKVSTEFIIEAPEHVTRHFLKKQKERTRMRALSAFNVEKKQKKQREEDAARQH